MSKNREPGFDLFQGSGGGFDVGEGFVEEAEEGGCFAQLRGAGGTRGRMGLDLRIMTFQGLDPEAPDPFALH
jgi:hypothetical protein